MTQRKQVDVEPQQVKVFLDKIARDRDRELQTIQTRKRHKIAQLRRQAFAESRRVHHQAIAQARARQSQKRDRQLATVQAKLRRRRWRVLTDVRQRVADAVLSRMMQFWDNPEQQWMWCRVWLTEARSRSGSEPIQIHLGRGTRGDVCERIKAMMADYPGHFEVLIDESAPEGIIIHWADHVLDGSLGMQYSQLLQSALRRVTRLVYPGSEPR